MYVECENIKHKHLHQALNTQASTTLLSILFYMAETQH